MAAPSSIFKAILSFFHSFSKSNTEENQNLYESAYKSSHTIQSKEVWAENVSFCSTQLQADAWVTANPTIGKKWTAQLLKPIAGSNGQAWLLDDGTANYIKNLIAPTDVSNASGFPSLGFELKLFRNDGVTPIQPTDGVWLVDYNSGIIHFQKTYTPTDMGYGIPRATCFQYIGKMQSDIGGGSVESGIPVLLAQTSDVSNENIEIDFTDYHEEINIIFVNHDKVGEAKSIGAYHSHNLVANNAAQLIGKKINPEETINITIPVAVNGNRLFISASDIVYCSVSAKKFTTAGKYKKHTSYIVPTANVFGSVYQVPVGATASELNMFILNRNSYGTAKIELVFGGVKLYEFYLPASETRIIDKSITMVTGDELDIKSSQTNISVNVYLNEAV